MIVIEVLDAVRVAGGERVLRSPLAERRWVKVYDPDAHAGRGFIDFTTDPTEAISFPSSVEAWEFWRQTSTTHPTRPDGKPNRPLTAYTVSIGELL